MSKDTQQMTTDWTASQVEKYQDVIKEIKPNTVSK